MMNKNMSVKAAVKMNGFDDRCEVGGFRIFENAENFFYHPEGLQIPQAAYVVSRWWAVDNDEQPINPLSWNEDSMVAEMVLSLLGRKPDQDNSYRFMPVKIVEIGGERIIYPTYLREAEVLLFKETGWKPELRYWHDGLDDADGEVRVIDYFDDDLNNHSQYCIAVPVSLFSEDQMKELRDIIA